MSYVPSKILIPCIHRDNSYIREQSPISILIINNLCISELYALVYLVNREDWTISNRRDPCMNVLGSDGVNDRCAAAAAWPSDGVNGRMM